MKVKYTVLVFLVLTIQSFSQSNSDGKIYHPFSGKFALSIDGGITYSSTDFKNNGIDYQTRAAVDYYIPTSSRGAFGVKLFGAIGYITGDGTPSSSPEFINTINFRTLNFYFGSGASFNYALSESVIPYLFGGVSYFDFDPKDKDGNALVPSLTSFSSNEIMITGETGLKFLFSENFGMNIAAGINYVNSDMLDGYELGLNKDIYFHALVGLSYYLGGAKDTDGDGVSDQNDQCPDTPPMVTVDEFGCPVDSDNDNVPDYADDCPNTPANIPVDIKGCPVDSDKDGIPDYLDLCNDTPANVLVEDSGCPQDNDNDGVPDYKDRCPDTPGGTEVDKFGCPKEVKFSEKAQKIQFDFCCGVFFEIGKAELLPAAYPELEKVLKVMKNYPDTKWKIEGHTDNKGNYNNNIELSKQRAQSVCNYFESKGIDKARLYINGYGPDFPVADNSTETGRTLNRRVTIALVSDELEKKNNLPETKKYNSAVERNVGKMVFTDGLSYCFQVASFRKKGNADYQVQDLKSKGYNAFVEIANIPGLGGTWYRVRVGYFDSREEAIKKRSTIIKD